MEFITLEKIDNPNSLIILFIIKFINEMNTEKSDLIEHKNSCKACIKFLPTLALSVFLVLGYTLQTVSLPYWLNTFVSGTGGPYFVLCWVSLIVALFYFIINGIIWIFKRTKLPSMKSIYKQLILQGFANCLNGIFVVYSAPISRTPPVFFLILSNLSIVFGIFTTKYIVKDKKYLRYCTSVPLISLAMLGVAVILMFVAKIIYESSASQYNWWIFLWAPVVIIGSFFGAYYNVLEERYFEKTEPCTTTVSNIDHISNVWFMLSWNLTFQFLFMVIFWWIDIIPVFGFSKIDTFFTTTFASVQCFFMQGGCDYRNMVFGFMFIGGYIITYLTSAFLYKDSANYTIYLGSAIVPIASLIFMIVGIGTESTPIWAIIPASILMFFGTIIWKYWEQKQKENNERIVPAPTN